MLQTAAEHPAQFAKSHGKRRHQAHEQAPSRDRVPKWLFDVKVLASTILLKREAGNVAGTFGGMITGWLRPAFRIVSLVCM